DVVPDADLLDLPRGDPRLHLAVGDPRRVLLAEQVIDAEEDQEGEEEIEDGEARTTVPHRAGAAGPPIRHPLPPVARSPAVSEPFASFALHPARTRARIVPASGRGSLARVRIGGGGAPLSAAPRRDGPRSKNKPRRWLGRRRGRAMGRFSDYP